MSRTCWTASSSITLIATSAPSCRASSSRYGFVSSAMSLPGFRSFAIWSMHNPMFPTPAMTTVSPSWISPRSTACHAQAIGSIYAAWPSVSESGTLCTSAFSGKRL